MCYVVNQTGRRAGLMGRPYYMWAIVLCFICCIWGFRLKAMSDIDRAGQAVIEIPRQSEKLNIRAQGLSDLGALLDMAPDTTIVEVNASNNQIADFDFKQLRHVLPKLSRLDLSGNQITKLRPHMFDGLPAHFKIDLSKNPVASLGKNTLKKLARLADKKITVSLYGTSLPSSTLEKMESSIMSSTTRLRVLQLSSLFVGAVLFVGGVALIILSDNLELKSSYQQLLKTASICVIVAGTALMAMEQCVRIVGHDIRQSRMFWREVMVS